MAQLYTDEDFPFGVVLLLRVAGHDVLTTPDTRRFNTWDAGQLRFATDARRTILTCNRRDFRALHEGWLLWSRFWREPRPHAGILIFDQVGGQAPASVYVTALTVLLAQVQTPIDNMTYDWFWRGGSSAWNQWRPEGIPSADQDDSERMEETPA